MPFLTRDDAEIHYDTEGDGFPVFIIAPGGMRSANDLWVDRPWNPRSALAGSYRVIGMDQRNAGRSTAPVRASDDWDTYTADQLAVLDELDVDQCHLIGMCIGGPFALALLQAAPHRFCSAVLLQPVGIDDNRSAFYGLFDDWAAALAPAQPDVTPDAWAAMRSNFWDGDFVLTATPDDLTTIQTPLLVCEGDDLYHPRSTSRAVASLAPNATLVEEWKTPDVLTATDARIRSFLAAHTP